MLTLAIDTSSGTSVALVDGGRIVREDELRDGRRHAEAIGPLLESVLGDARPDRVVVGMGPGPFTGLRVGIAAARAFALGRGIDCVGVLSHDALGAGADRPTIVVTDARRREAAWSRYEDGRLVLGPLLAPHEALDDALAAHGVDPAEPRAEGPWLRAARLAIALDDGTATILESPAYLREADATVPGAPKRVTG